MANIEHLKIMKQGVGAWNKWRNENKEIKPFLAGAFLPNFSFGSANLKDVDFYKAVLCSSNFNNADLTNANLSSANLIGASMLFANLSRTNFSFASLQEVNLTKANLNYTDFNGCEFGYTTIGLTNLSNAKNLETIKVSGDCSVDYQTLMHSKNMPKEFIFKLGISDLVINYLPELKEDKTFQLHPVFLSHSSNDKIFATKLYNELIKKNVRVWYDEKQLLPGDDIRRKIDRGIKQYDKFILVCSEHSLKSWWVDEELDRAFEKKKQLYYDKEHHIQNIIPITIDDYVFEDWESEFKSNILRMKVGDFRMWKDQELYNQKVGELVTVLNVNREEDFPKSLF